jgi:hypothetical protein
LLPASSDGACNFSIMEFEEDVVVLEEGLIAVNEEVPVPKKQEEFAEDIATPDIKSEPEEVSYVCVCLILNTFYTFSDMSVVFVTSVFLFN